MTTPDPKLKVLIPVDLNEDDPRAQDLVDDIVAFLSRTAGTFDLLFVDLLASPDTSLTGDLAALLDTPFVHRESALRTRLVNLLETLPPERRGVARVVSDGGAAERIASLASAYDVVAMGTHGRSGLLRWWLGSVTERVVRSSPVPVLVLPTRVATPLQGPSPRLLCAVDAYDVSDAFLHEVGSWALRLGAVVDTLYVMPPIVPEAQPASAYGPILTAHLATANEHALARLTSLTATWPDGTRGESRVRVGAAASVVSTAAEGYFGVVVSTHGRQGLGRFFLGSVAERIVRSSPAPVLVLPAPVD